MLDDVELGPALLREDDPIRAGDPHLLATDLDDDLISHGNLRW
jgi:hypothetical protein